jgi:hypothetical protein
MLLLLLLALQDPDADAWVRKLGDESGPVREGALQALRALDEAALPALRRGSTHPDAEVRARAGELLYRIEWLPWLDPALLNRYPPLRDLFRAGDHPGVLAWAAEHPAWRHGFAARFEAYAIRLLEHPDLALRKAATEVLEAVPVGHDAIPRRPVGVLASLIAAWDPDRHEDPEREWLLRIVLLARRHASGLDLPRLREARAGHPEAARTLDLLRYSVGDLSVGPAVAEAATSEGPLRWTALQVLRDRPYVPARTALLEALRRAKGPDRWDLRGTLAVVADPSCSAALLEGLPPLNVEGRSGHLDQLGVAGVREALPAFLESARASYVPYERDAALRGLVRLRAPEAFEALLESIARGESLAAVPLLAGLLDGSNAPRLLKVLECPNDACRRGAREALRQAADPGVHEAVLRRLDSEREQDLRFDLIHAILHNPSVDPEGRSLAEACERIARDAGDPLAPPAAARLLRAMGEAALPIIEALAERLESPGRDLGLEVQDRPSDRLIPAARRWWERDASAFELVRFLERLGTPAALAELERLADRQRKAGVHCGAGFALFRLGVDASRFLGEDPYWSFDGATVRREIPALRELFRKQVREQGVREDLAWAASNWAHPEMIPAFLKFLDGYDRERRLPDPRDEAPEFSGLLGPRWTALDVLNALAATGDRSLVPYFLARAEDFEPGLQLAAVRTLGRFEAREAVPLLRRLVRCGAAWLRAEAIDALGRIGGPGVAEFLKSELRDNPRSAPYALARLGVRCPEELVALLDDRGPAGPVAGALDLMENAPFHAKIDALLPSRAELRVDALPELVRAVTGHPSRLSAAARRASADLAGATTLREVLHALECGPTHEGGRLTHLVRDGTIEICTVEEAVGFWRTRFQRR